MGLFPKRKKRYFLALDFGSSFIKALIVDKGKNGHPPAIIGAASVRPDLALMRGGVVSDIDGVVEAVRSAMAEAKADCGLRPKEAVIGVSGGLVGGVNTTLRLERETPSQPIDAEELTKVVGEIKEIAWLETAKEAGELAGDPNLEVEVIESSLSAVKVDGYYNRNLLGFTGKVLEVSLFTAFSPRPRLENLRSALRKLKVKPLAFRSNLAAVVSVLAPPEAVDFNAIILDIGGGVTDVAVVLGGGIMGTRKISFGSQDFTRALADEFKLPFAEAEEKKLAFGSGEVVGEELSKIRGAIKPAVERWCSGVEIALADFEGVKTFPDRMVLTGGGSGLPDLREALIARPWTRALSFTAFPKIETLDITVWQGKIEDRTDKLIDEADVVPASLALTGVPPFNGGNHAANYFRT